MTEISAEQKEKAKKAAANLSVAANDAAVALGVTGALAAAGLIATGVGAFAGVGVGAALAVSSFGAWWVGNRYQRLANDPPRDDYGVVEVTAAQSQEAGLSTAEIEPTARQLAIQELILADGLECLVRSIERYDGAVRDGDLDAAKVQLDAVGQNARAVRAAQAFVCNCAEILNDAWANVDVDMAGLSIESLQQQYLQSAGPPHQTVGAALQGLLDSISGLRADQDFGELDGSSDPVMTLTAVPPKPDSVVPLALNSAMSELSSALDALVTDGGVA
jgi:hypothetical protein